MTAPKRILLATLGSLGDLHPYLAVGRALVRRGHAVTLATHGFYRSRAAREGLGFVAIPPEMAPGPELDALLVRAMSGPAGSEFVIKGLVLPHLAAQAQALAPAVDAADVLVSHPLTFTLPLLAARSGKPWASVALQPMFLGSALDASAHPNAVGLTPLLRASPVLLRAFLGLGRRATRAWFAPLDAIRTELGLPASAAHPMFEGAFSPHLHLCLFSSALARPQADWPRSSVQPGFAFYDRGEGEVRLSEAAREFLERHPEPLVFTLGSSAVRVAGRFYAESAAAARRIGRAAILVTDDATVAAGLTAGLGAAVAGAPDDVLVAGYEPYSMLFPRAAAIVHQGGAGTTGQALRAGRPMLVVPFAHDQPDHALRITRAGLGAWIPRRRYGAGAAARALSRMLADPSMAARARAAGQVVAGESGAEGAAQAIESLA